MRLGEPMTIPFHRLESGSLLLFTFFMISDPKTTPDSRIGRIAFAVRDDQFEWVAINVTAEVLDGKVHAKLVPLAQECQSASHWHVQTDLDRFLLNRRRRGSSGRWRRRLGSLCGLRAGRRRRSGARG